MRDKLFIGPEATRLWGEVHFAASWNYLLGGFLTRRGKSTHNVRRVLKALLPLWVLLYTPAFVQAAPPYAVICYASTGNESSATNINAGAGPGINWTTDVPWNDITVVADAFLLPNANYTFSNGGAREAALIIPAHANGVRCIVALSAGAFSTLCQPGNTGPFASAVTAMMMQYGYDGVEVDWEQTGVASQANATAMMQAMYTAIKALPNSTVDNLPRTLSFTTNPSYSQIYNMTTLGSYTDWCFFMGYDWYDTPATYANGPLNGVNPSIAGTIASMTNGSQWSYPISKMVVGCPLYTNDYNAGVYYDTLSILHLGTAQGYNASYAEQAYTAPNGNTVYVDTAQSFCDKINWSLTSGCKGIGLWDMGQALPYTDSAVTAIWNTIGGQASCLNLGPTNTPTKTPTPVVASTWRVVAGGPAHTDCNGNVWAADENYVGGLPATSTNTITGALPCTTDQALYQDQRYGNPFSYVFNVPAGSYQVTLKFAETYWTAAGARQFNVSINGTTELTNFDVYATAGGQNIAVDRVFNNIAPSGGAITITLGPASVDNALVSSLQIIPQPATATATSTHTSTAASTHTATSTSTATSTATHSSTSTSTSVVSSTATQTSTQTPSNSPTASATASSTPTATASGTLTPVNTNTAANTASSTATATSSNTATSTSTSSMTQTSTATLTNTATSTPAVPTATQTNSSTLNNPATHTSTATASSTNTRTPSSTATAAFSNTATATAKAPTATCTTTATPTLTSTTAPPTLTSTPSLGHPVVYPNPVTSDNATLQLPVMNATHVTVEILTLAMRKVQTISVARVEGNTLPVRLADKGGTTLANGLYYFLIQANGQRWITKVLVLR